MRTRHFLLLILNLIYIFCGNLLAADAISITCDKPDGVYQLGQPIQFHVQWNGPGEMKSSMYSLKSGGRTVIEKGSLSFVKDEAVVTTRLDQPNTMLLDLTVNTTDGTQKHGVGGAVAAGEKIVPAAT